MPKVDRRASSADGWRPARRRARLSVWIIPEVGQPPTFRQKVAAKFSAHIRDLRVPAWGETLALGAAFWAMRGVGILPALEGADGLVAIGPEFHPRPAEAAVYDQLYPIYAEVYRSLTSPTPHRQTG